MNIIGNKYGRWTVIKNDPKDQRKVICKCDCGTVKSVNIQNLKRGFTESCGCKKREITIARNLKHGGTKTRLYYVWHNMIRRCKDPRNNRYMNYGGRGINVCEEWQDFAKFREWALSTGYDETAEYGKCTIERLDVNGNYEPSNCTWKTIKEQCSNRTSNVWLSYNGKTQTVSEWEDEFHVGRDRIANRIRRGWTIEEALSIPLGGKRGKSGTDNKIHITDGSYCTGSLQDCR